MLWILIRSSLPFFLFPQKHILWYSLEAKALLMSTNNICFCGEIRKMSILFGWKKASYWELHICICVYFFCLQQKWKWKNSDTYVVCPATERGYSRDAIRLVVLWGEYTSKYTGLCSYLYSSDTSHSSDVWWTNKVTTGCFKGQSNCITW